MPRPGASAVVLVSGFPSLYARRMIEHILEAEPQAQIYVLLPPAASAAAREGASPSSPPPDVAFGHLDEDKQARMLFIEGDPTAMDLGLSGAEFRRLTREVDRIHHLAHASSINASLPAARALNIVATAEIIEFARAASNLECLVFHSTAHVSGDRTGVVYEDDLDHGQSFPHEVERTRMQAEHMVRRAMREVPIAVVRPTTIVGAATADGSERLDGLYLLVLLVLLTPGDLALPLPGRGDTPLNIVPLAYVIQAAHAIGKSPASPGRTFHLADTSPRSARSVFDLVAHADGRRAARGQLPSNLAKALLRTPGIERFIRSPRAFVEQLTTQVRYDTRNTEQALRGSGIACPPFESYVGDLVSAVRDHLDAQKQRRRVSALETEVEDPLS
jgi:nucleoside-diphosphate-sugar epimerase